MKRLKRAQFYKCLALMSAGIAPLLLWAAPGSVSYQYDETGRLRSSTYNDGMKTNYTLDATGNRTSVTAGGMLTVSAASSISEASGSVTATVTRGGATGGAISVTYGTSNGTATAGSDYTATSGTLSWASGDGTNKTFTVPLINDNVYEPGETFVVTLSTPTGGAWVGSPSTATITIANDDAAPSFSVNNVSVSEAGGTATVTVTKTGSTTVSHAVSYATANGSAVAGSDYTTASGTLTFTASETSKTFTVPILNDSIYEGGETFAVNLSSATNGATISSGTGTLTVNEDDAGPVFSINGNWNYENGGSIVFMVTKSGSTTVSHAVNYSSGDWAPSATNATAGADYTPASGTLTFAPNETTKTITVYLIDDDLAEQSEYFYVALSNATNGAAISSTYYGTGGITDNEYQAILSVYTSSLSSGDGYTWHNWVGGLNSFSFSPNMFPGGSYVDWWGDHAWGNNSGYVAPPMGCLQIMMGYTDSSWLVSATINGQTKTGASASFVEYTYDGAATANSWCWTTTFGLTGNGATLTGTVVHH